MQTWLASRSRCWVWPYSFCKSTAMLWPCLSLIWGEGLLPFLTGPPSPPEAYRLKNHTSVFGLKPNSATTCNFCWKPDMLFSVIGTELNRPLVWGFVLIWLAAWRCLVFSLSTGTSVFRLLYCFCLCLHSWHHVPLSSSQRIVPGSSFCWGSYTGTLSLW